MTAVLKYWSKFRFFRKCGSNLTAKFSNNNYVQSLTDECQRYMLIDKCNERYNFLVYSSIYS